MQPSPDSTLESEILASVEGLEGCEGGSTYNASKGGVVLLTAWKGLIVWAA